MSIEVTCNCGARFMAIPELAGKTVRCPTCGGPLEISALSPLEPLDVGGPLDALGGFNSNDPLGMPVTTRPQPAAARRRKTSSGNSKKALMLGGFAGAGVLGFALLVVIVWVVMAFGPRKYGTPEAVFEANRKAVRAKDWKTVYDTLTPEAQEQTVAALAITVVLAGQFDKDLQAIGKKHGIETSPMDLSSPGNPQERFARMVTQMQGGPNTAAAQVKNKRVFFLDVMNCMAQKNEEMLKKVKSSAVDNPSVNSRLTNVVIDGNTARGEGSTTVGGRTSNTPVRFKKVDGSWRLDLNFGEFNANGTTNGRAG